MSKLSKRQKKELKKASRFGELHYEVAPKEKFTLSQVKISSILKENIFILLGLVALVVLIYFNSLDNQLTLVDDLQAFSFNESIKDLNASVKTLNLQQTFYSLVYRYFGFDPLPLRIASVFMHAVTTVLFFVFARIIFNKKIAILASLLFAVHAVNTEAVTWISGMPYLFIGLFNFLIFIFYLQYKRFNSKKDLYIAFFIYLLMMVLLKSPWVLVLPIALVVIDQFLLEERMNKASLWWLVLFIIPIAVYMFTIFGSAFKDRMDYRAGSGGDRVTLYAQSLKPVIEGYPYTTFMMTKLYLFPKDLTVYYDGTPVTTFLYVSMYFVFALYVYLVFYFWKKNRKIAGLLIILPVLMAPSYSPIKVTWFLAERYMYSGTAFFSIIVALSFYYLEKRIGKAKIIYGFFAVIIIGMSLRTFYRNDDWQDTVSLSFANMKTSPHSVRPYNDIAGHYYYLGDIIEAVKYYEKGLEVLPNSGTSISNLGFLYFERGPLIFWDDYEFPEPNKELALKYFNNASNLTPDSMDARIINYFLNMALVYDPTSPEIASILGDLYVKMSFPEQAQRLYSLVLQNDSENEYALEKLKEIEKL